MELTIKVDEETIKEIKKIWTADEKPSLVEEKHKFKVGDIVVGNDVADYMYGITRKGVKLKVVKLNKYTFVGQIVSEGGNFGDCEYCVSYNCFDKVEEEQKTVCAMVMKPCFTFDKTGMALVGTVAGSMLDVSNGWLKKHGVDTGCEDEKYIWFYPLQWLEVLSK